ncbi:DUF1007 family protein [Hwanghaeella sp.]|uniref:DUF1007 family protein n=1 Tax=Hwanghaeella sp. TaxID=2605943 RepID=UPI003CCBFE78
MIRHIRLFTACLFGIIALFATATSAKAHPHAWIDLRSGVILNAEGKVEALTLEWRFDEFYSAFILEDIARAGEVTEEALATLAVENLVALRDYNYFVEAQYDGKPVALGEARDGTMTEKNKRLVMRFVVSLAEPVDPKTNGFEYAVYDPSYYVEILHVENDLVTIAGPGAGECLASIASPDPDAETVGLAASLGKNEQGPAGIGRLFAEVVAVTCNDA